MAEEDVFKQLLIKEFTPEPRNPTADIGKSTPPLSKVNATGELLGKLFNNPNTGTVNFHESGHGAFTLGKVRLGFELRETHGQVILKLDNIPYGLKSSELSGHRDIINKLHNTFGIPEKDVSYVNSLSGANTVHAINVPEKKVVELSQTLLEKKQASTHETVQILRAFASGDEAIVRITLQAQQAATEAASGSAELDELLDRPFKPAGNPETNAIADGHNEFQKLLQGAGKPEAGHADIKVLAATAGAMGILSAGAKAAITHLAPAGIEPALQAQRVSEISDLADSNLSKKLLTEEQYKIINQYTTAHAVAVSATSLAPDPTGLSSDAVAKQSDERLVNALVAAGLPEQQANQYRLGSMTGSLKEIGQLIGDKIENLQEVRQEMASHGSVPLSLALNIKPEQLQALGALSDRLGDNPLQKEVSRLPYFEPLAHLPPEQIGHLARLSAAGLDPKVQVQYGVTSPMGEISPVLERPQQLSPDPKKAFTEAASYVLASGDHQYRAPDTSPVEVQATVAGFGKMYKDLSQRDGLNSQDMNALSHALKKISQGFDHPDQLQGVVANYRGEHLAQLNTQEPEKELTL